MSCSSWLLDGDFLEICPWSPCFPKFRVSLIRNVPALLHIFRSFIQVSPGFFLKTKQGKRARVCLKSDMMIPVQLLFLKRIASSALPCTESTGSVQTTGFLPQLTRDSLQEGESLFPPLLEQSRHHKMAPNLCLAEDDNWDSLCCPVVKVELHYTDWHSPQRAANGGSDPSWLNLAFLGPRFSIQRSPNPLKVGIWGPLDWKSGRPKTAKSYHHGSDPPFAALWSPTFMKYLSWGGCMRERMNEWMNEWMSEWVSEWVNEWKGEWQRETVGKHVFSTESYVNLRARPRSMCSRCKLLSDLKKYHRLLSPL